MNTVEALYSTTECEQIQETTFQLCIQEAADRLRAVAAAVPTISAAPEVLYDKYYQLVIID